jgi:hypothetical protein
MYSRTLLFFWRRKFVFVSTMILAITALWFVTSLYSSHSGGDQDRIMSIKELMFNGKSGQDEGMVVAAAVYQKLESRPNGLDAQAVKFVAPTAHAPTRKGELDQK